jgi:glycosyltransferase involved in cell wall biosynthesis
MSEITVPVGVSRRVAYLISRYPAVSHTFILREVRQLRECGMHIETASINPPDMRPEAMPAAEAEEAARTYYVKQHGVAGAVAAHIFALATRPGDWMRGLLYGVTMGGTDVRRVLAGMAYFTEALMVGRWMRRNRLSHLHVHFATAAANVGLYVKKVFGFSLSLTVHGPDEFDNVNAQWLPEKISCADFIFCIGRYARSQVMRLSAQEQWAKFEVAPLGVDPKRYAQKARVKGAGPFQILCVGRLAPAKGQHILVQAASILRDAGHEFCITMVGTGPDEAGLKRAVAKAGLDRQVIFTGALNQDQVRALYAKTDAFALPSFAEGIPIVLMEAMASSIPCVTTRITGIPELIRNASEGLLVAPSDAVELAQALTLLIQDPVTRARIGTAGRARVEADFDLGRNTARLGQLFMKRLDALPC